MHFSWRKRKIQRDRRWPSKAEFIRQIDFLVDLFELDPALPEIQYLKDAYDKLSTISFDMGPRWYLQLLNPLDSVELVENRVDVSERLFGHVLESWSLVRHHCPWVDARLTHIVADNTGTHLFEGDWEMARLYAGTINPHRLGDPGTRYRIACAIIKEFTGLDLIETQQIFIGGTKTITVTKSADDTWSYELEQLPQADNASS